jgi:hypothetical protein
MTQICSVIRQSKHVTLQNFNNIQGRLKGKAIVIFSLRVLCDPEHNCRQHQGHILRDVGVAIVCILLRVVLHDIFEHKKGLKESLSI